ncbi:MAG: sterol desaturase family protein [Chitinophagaceae bacterium]
MWQSIQAYLDNNWLLAISTPFYIILIAAEVLWSNYRKIKLYSVKETAINLWLNIANTALGLSIKFFILMVLGFFFKFSFVHIPNPYLYWFVLFLGVDICFYFEHRAAHFSRILWAIHVTHHSSQEFNLTTGFRSSVFRPFVSFFFFIPLAFLGFNPLDILFMDALCQIYGIIVHTQYIIKMPKWFEAIFVTPSHHRVHHASNILYLDKNMGMVLIVWDRIFNTFQQELHNEKVVYGLTKNPDKPHHPLMIIFHEWIQLGKDVWNKKTNVVEKIKYILYPPGWSHDGSTKTSHELRKELKENKL